MQSTEESVRRLIEKNVDDLHDDASRQKHIAELKSKFREHHISVSQLMKFHQDCGCSSAANSAKDDRSLVQREINDVIQLINSSSNDNDPFSEIASQISRLDSVSSDHPERDLSELPCDDSSHRVQRLLDFGNLEEQCNEGIPTAAPSPQDGSHVQEDESSRTKWHQDGHQDAAESTAPVLVSSSQNRMQLNSYSFPKSNSENYSRPNVSFNLDSAQNFDCNNRNVRRSDNSSASVMPSMSYSGVGIAQSSMQPAI